MSDIELVITWSRRLERLLVRRYGARGRGLHALTTSVRHRLPEGAEKALRYVATLRNRVVHDERFRLRDPSSFVQAARGVERSLGRSLGLPRLSKGPLLCTTAVLLYAVWEVFLKALP